MQNKWETGTAPSLHPRTFLLRTIIFSETDFTADEQCRLSKGIWKKSTFKSDQHIEQMQHKIKPATKKFKKPSPEQTVGYTSAKTDRTFWQFSHPVKPEIQLLRETEMNETERGMFPCFDSAYRNLMLFEDISSAKWSISMKIVGLQRATHPDPAHRNWRLSNADKPSKLRKQYNRVTHAFWDSRIWTVLAEDV
jgi:hypothetical protein